MLLFAGLTVLLTAALAFVLRENGRLRERFAVLAATKARAGGLELERPVPPIRLADASGVPIPVRFEGEALATLLLFHASGCDACATTSASWRESLAAAARPDVRVLCIQTDGAEGTPLTLDGLPPSLAVPLPPAGWLAALPAVPATLLVDDRGALVWAEYGALSKESTRSLTEALASVGMRTGR
jgi:hypothetical protein